ncbi:MAG: hypothetical protein J7604_00295 [Sporocytophaga sp.]|uniref:hypothetical protein n=1 Tax=Sporocytophaga sp. TaxID=2231183 RepID=UPI001B20AFD3|nr:hypothetical protein [Sporocytophaga sp.]MBO9698611.1 hypothetical protein [Sporocytophaga sp.]
MENKLSKNSLIISCVILFFASFFYYPKWEKPQSEATISWDVNGYYYYLPAIFIYKDIRELKFTDSILNKYHQTSGIDHIAMPSDNGKYVLKYSIGQSLLYFPFFLIGHFYALSSNYPADGFSFPYQIAIGLGSLIVAFIGLYYLRKVLLNFFSDKITAITLFLISIGTNYLNYSSIDGAMTHNNLFTVYCILIYSTISFYKNPDNKKALIIGACIGLAALIRPTEIISILIPILWGLDFGGDSIQTRINFFRENSSKLRISAIICIALGSIQLIYWKYSSGHWLFYSYGEQSFSWTKPHLYNGIFSYRTGWLVYSPIMVFSIIGFLFLLKDQRKLFIPTAAFASLFIYICFAWDIWWYGGSLGQRAMIQSYPILAFPLAIFIERIQNLKLLNYAFLAIATLFVYFNIWLTHQAHLGGLLYVGQMTKSYFWKVVGRYEVSEDVFKLLDTDEEFTAERTNVKVLYKNDFESDTLVKAGELEPIAGSKSLMLDASNQYSPIYKCPINPEAKGEAKWVRVKCNFRCKNKEWDTWKMAQFIVRYCDRDNVVKEKSIRVFRMLTDGQTKDIYIDTKMPEQWFDNVQVLFWNSGSSLPLAVDNIEIESYK